MFERFTREARQCVIEAEGEARALGDQSIDSHHLLLGVLRAGDTAAAATLRDAGITHDAVRAASTSADPESLRALGIDLDAVRHAVDDAFGEGALARAMSSPPEGRRRRGPGFTPGAKKVLELSLREAIALQHRSIGSEHILLALLREGGRGSALLAAMAPEVDLRHLLLERLRTAS